MKRTREQRKRKPSYKTDDFYVYGDAEVVAGEDDPELAAAMASPVQPPVEPLSPPDGRDGGDYPPPPPPPATVPRATGRRRFNRTTSDDEVEFAEEEDEIFRPKPRRPPRVASAAAAAATMKPDPFDMDGGFGEDEEGEEDVMMEEDIEEEEEEEEEEDREMSYEEIRRMKIQRNRELLRNLKMADVMQVVPRRGRGRGSAMARPNRRRSLDPNLLRRSLRVKGLEPNGRKPEEAALLGITDALLLAEKGPKSPVVHAPIPKLLNVADALRPPMRGMKAVTADQILGKLRQSASNPDPQSAPAEAGELTPARRGKASKKQADAAAKKAYEECRESWLAVKLVAERKMTTDRIFSLGLIDRSDTDVVAAGSVHGDIGIWHVSGRTSAAYTAHGGHRPISGLQWTNSGRTLFSAGYDGALRKLDVTTGTSDTILSAPSMPDGRKAGAKFGLCGLALETNGHVALCGSLNGSLITIDDRIAENPVAAVNVHGAKICTVQLHPADENVAVTSSHDGTAAVWDLRTLLGRARHQHTVTEMFAEDRGTRAEDRRGCVASYGHRRPVTSAFVSPFPDHALLTNCHDGLIRWWSNCLSSTPATDPNRTWRHDNRTGRFVTNFQALWDPHHEGLALIGSLNKRIRVFGFWPGIGTLFDLSFHDRRIVAPPAVNSFHQYHEFTTASASNFGQVQLWGRWDVTDQDLEDQAEEEEKGDEETEEEKPAVVAAAEAVTVTAPSSEVAPKPEEKDLQEPATKKQEMDPR